MDKNKIKTEIWEWVKSFLVAAFLAFCIIRPFIIEAFKIPSGSMRPTLLEGDRILVNKFIYGARIPFTEYHLPGLGKPQRGDIVVFISPEDGRRDFIKRLVAFGGEKVEIKDGTIFINQKPLRSPIFNQIHYYNRGKYGGEDEEIVVTPNSYFVLGDNSSSSRDSRYWGFVPQKNVIGKALLIFWPLHRIRIIK